MASMFELGILLSLIDTASAPLRQFGGTLQQTGVAGANAMQRIGASMERVSMHITAMGGASIALGEELRHFTEKPIEAFAEMDSALNDLAVASLDKTGKIGAGFDDLKEKVMQIDARLPMTTAQVSEVGTALMKLGTTQDQLLGGALDAAANLAVILKLPAELAGEMTAKIRESYQLQSNELPKAADLIQRVSFAGGIKPDEQLEFMKYAGGSVNALGLTGLENARKIGAIQVEASLQGITGSIAGTGFGGLLTDFAKVQQKLHSTRGGGEAVAMLKKAGLSNLSFFGSTGKFAGMDSAVATLADMRNKLLATGGEKAVLEGFNKLFGAEHARMALLIAKGGVAGYQAAQKRMDDQASADQRIGQTMQSFENRLTVLKSNITNALGTMAAPAMQALEPYIDKLADGVSVLREWAGQHKELSKWIMIILGGATLLLTTFGSLALTAGLFAKVASGPLMLLGKLGGGGFSRIAAAARGLGAAMPVAITALRSLALALLGIPGIGWIAAAIAAVAFLVYRYWTPIKSFVSGLWAGLSAGFAPVWAILRPALAALGSSFMSLIRALRPLGSALSVVFFPLFYLLRPLFPLLQSLWRAFASLFAPINSTGNAARDLGMRVGTAIAGAMKWVAQLDAQLLSLPARFLRLGADVVNGLVSGIANRLSAARNSITSLGNNIKTWFATTLGIHSPSRVFMGFGQNISQGTEIGILSRLGAVRGATGRMSSAAVDGALAIARRPLPAAGDSGAHGSAAAAGAGMVVHFSPVIHVGAGAGTDVGNQVSAAMRTAYAEFERQMDRYLAAKRRVSFAG
ncbi:phage tail tape measure protein [Burkholderia cenocepacia]|uniref:phage tail tape measure protein n=1 Tax=Burkholderia cenocepacia TaxID=95486 RepID=UPI001AA1C025|nr:phage tail tape measure protein [Burkholderia cenocepacia]MBO1856852.1 phage tail tape measure protein [Burkholderia cenocepacia]